MQDPHEMLKFSALSYSKIPVTNRNISESNSGNKKIWKSFWIPSHKTDYNIINRCGKPFAFRHHPAFTVLTPAFNILFFRHTCGAMVLRLPVTESCSNSNTEFTYSRKQRRGIHSSVLPINNSFSRTANLHTSRGLNFRCFLKDS